MKKFRIFAAVMAIVVALSAMFGLVACGGDPTQKPGGDIPGGDVPEAPPAEYTVTFDYQMDGFEDKTTKVTENNKVDKPADPTCEGFTFEGWFSDAACTTEFAFGTGITADTTVYAKWKNNAKNYYKVTFNLNYTGAPTSPESDVEEGTAAVKPSAPRRSDAELEFTGWYVDKECTLKYDFNTLITEDKTVYACWMETRLNVFEAEYTKVKGLKGKGYSNEASGVGLIVHDGNGAIGEAGPAKASNGFFISYFYVNGLTLTFNIVSDRDVEASTLSMRLSGELVPTVELTDEEWVVKVNNEEMKFGKIVIDNIDTDMSNETKREFQDFVVTTELHLVEGNNVITMTVNNTKKMQGAIGCTAPLIDCIKIVTSAQLSWTPVTSNLSGFED